MVQPVPVKAAQYVRMSTDKQVYSTANQKTAIASYALLNGFELVRTYADEGRSGLHLKGRHALQEMLRDVLSGDAGFQAVLVYDVSRWGRFQDADESAHYEFICRSAGVAVHYCAELFVNDGSLASTIMKNLRRAMAGEFSRDLSDKVWAAQCRLAAQGHKMGGTAPYGMRRLLLDEHGVAKGVLKPGEVKNLRSDRVTLIPGPAEEIAAVRRIFRLSGERGLTDNRIAELLNRSSVPTDSGKPWTRFTVKRVLTCEAYLGHNVYNRTTSKLGKRKATNKPSQWVRCENVFEPIIGPRAFEKVRAARLSNRRIYSDEELLRRLRLLLDRDGKISALSIQQSKLTPSLGTYRKRFGSLDQIYARVGFSADQFTTVSLGRGQAHHAVALLNEATTAIAGAGGNVREAPARRVLVVDEQVNLGVTVARYVRSPQANFWRVMLHRAGDIDFLLVGLMDRANSTIASYYLLPRSRFPKCGKTCIVDGGNRLDGYRLEGLADLYDAIAVR